MNNNKSDNNGVFYKTSISTKLKGVGSESVFGSSDIITDVWTISGGCQIIVLLHVKETADKARGYSSQS